MGGLRFGVDGDGNYGYYGADDSLIPFKSFDADTVEEIAFQAFINGDSSSKSGICTQTSISAFSWQTVVDGTYFHLENGRIKAKVAGYYLACSGALNTAVYQYYEAGTNLVDWKPGFAIKFKD